MDLPMPGSPPSKVTEPATMPPPNTRSSSPMPVATALAGVTSTSAIGRGAAAGDAPTWRAVAGSTRSSINVFHARQPGHRPTHVGLDVPQSSHRKIVFARAMATTLTTAYDSAA